MLYHKSRCVAHVFGACTHSVGGADIHWGVGDGGWKYLQLLATRWITKCLQPTERASEGEKTPRVSTLFFFYCISQLCCALIRLQRGTVESWELTESLFFCCLKSPHARLRSLAGNHTGLMGWIHIRRVFPCGINAEQATIPSTLPSDVQTATIYLDVFRKSWQSSSPTCFDKVLPREFGGTSDAVELRDNDELW